MFSQRCVKIQLISSTYGSTLYYQIFHGTNKFNHLLYYLFLFTYSFKFSSTIIHVKYNYSKHILTGFNGSTFVKDLTLPSSIAAGTIGIIL